MQDQTWSCGSPYRFMALHNTLLEHHMTKGSQKEYNTSGRYDTATYTSRLPTGPSMVGGGTQLIRAYVLGTFYIDQFIRSIRPLERRVVPFHSIPVSILTYIQKYAEHDSKPAVFAFQEMEDPTLTSFLVSKQN